MNDEEKRDEEWDDLYNALSKSLRRFGVENAYGEADYWLVDDDYGDTTHKVCVHRLSFLRKELIVAIQQSIKSFPNWKVMVQLEMSVDGASTAQEGFLIYPDRVEQHWDSSKFSGLAKKLGL